MSDSGSVPPQVPNNIVTMFGQPVPDSDTPVEPYDEAVESLEALLELAKTGQLTGLAFATAYANGSCCFEAMSQSGSNFALSHALHALNAHYALEIIENIE